MYSGPCFLPLIFGILIRFRIGKIGIVADIKQAFLQIGISEEHNNFLRFLWFKDAFSTNPDQIILPFKRVIFGFRFSLFLLIRTVGVRLEKYLPLSFDFYKISKIVYLMQTINYGNEPLMIKHFSN